MYTSFWNSCYLIEISHALINLNCILGCFCVYANSESFEYVRESLEKTLLSNLEQDDRLPFQGLPIVLMFVGDVNLDEKEVLRLREEGQSLSDRYFNNFCCADLAYLNKLLLISKKIILINCSRSVFPVCSVPSSMHLLKKSYLQPKDFHHPLLSMH